MKAFLHYLLAFKMVDWITSAKLTLVILLMCCFFSLEITRIIFPHDILKIYDNITVWALIFDVLGTPWPYLVWRLLSSTLGNLLSCFLPVFPVLFLKCLWTGCELLNKCICEYMSYNISLIFSVFLTFGFLF